MAAPIREQLRDQALEIHKCNQLAGNNEKSNLSAQLAAIIAVLQAIKVQVDAATNVNLL